MDNDIIQQEGTLLSQCEGMYSKYGRYINKWRAFPLYDDGLKLVERRVLYSEYLVARKKLTKSAEVVGYCMGKLHPHGDCLSGDTVIPLLNGEYKTIQELSENYKDKKFYVYSCDPVTLEIVPGLAHSPRVGQITDTMYKITLDNGEVVKCTSNHPFMTRWKRRPRYIKASELKVGESLRSLSLKKTDSGYLTYSYYGKDIPIHKLVGDYFYKHDNGYVYHHIDGNIYNNDPENLSKLTISEHAKIHLKDKKFKDKCLESLYKGRIEMFSDNGKYRDKIRKKNIQLITEYNKNHIYALDRAKIYIKKLSQDIDNITAEDYNKYRKQYGYNIPTLDTLINKKYINNFEDLLNSSDINHKVVSIEIVKLDKPIKFYDITVDTYHNFAIGQGIFVHNSSIYGSLVQLCNCGLSDYNGNFGTDIGLHEEPPAAMRYTEVKMNEDVVKMAFQHLDFIPFESLELPMKEPIYLATKLPFCLIRGKNYTAGIGFGFDTYIPSYNKYDLVKRLKWLLTKEGDEPIIKPVTDCELDNTDTQYKQLLEQAGVQSLKYKGIAILDKKDKSIIIKSICPSKKWSTVLNAFKDEIQVQKSIGYIDESCGNETSVRFKILKRGQDIDKIYKKICNLITGEVKFRCNMCDTQGNIQMYSVDQMLLRAYQRYKEANIKYLEFGIQKCQQIIDELNIVQKIKTVLPECLKQYPDDIDKLIQEVNRLISVEIDVLKNLFEKYTIPRFTKCKTDTTEKQNIKIQLENNLKDIDKFTWRLYEQL